MEVKFSNTASTAFIARTSTPSVVRLLNGHVQMNGDTALFPDSCPRCGGSPAKTMVKLRLTKPIHRTRESFASAEATANLRLLTSGLFKMSNHGTKIPFCRRCGWTIRAVQYLPAILGGAVTVFLGPAIEHSHPRQLPWYSSGVAVVAGMLTAGLVPAAFEYMPRLILRSGVKVVAATKDSAELVFDDLMYAERFVLLNR